MSCAASDACGLDPICQIGFFVIFAEYNAVLAAYEKYV